MQSSFSAYHPQYPLSAMTMGKSLAGQTSTQNQFQATGNTKAKPPDSIIPMHEHPGPTLPHETQKRWNTLATVGVLTTTLGALAMIGTKFSAFENVLKSRLSEKTWNWLIKDGKKELSSRAWQIIGIGGLMQGVNRYETAANTNQPSKLIAALTGTAQAFLYLFTPAWWVQAIGFGTAALLYAGEQNDIENSNHPDKRREWDINKLTQSVSNHTFKKEFSEASRFVLDDIKEGFSVRHWKATWGSIKKLAHGYKASDWETPQSYQSALGVQFSTISLLFNIVTNGFAKSLNSAGKAIEKTVQQLGSWTNFLGSAIPQMPVWIRAWENRDQADGQLVIWGSPLITLGRVLQMNAKTKDFGGIAFVGDAVKGKGLALNSQKYLALLNEMRSLDKTALEAPYITASMILGMIQTSPDVMHRLREQMGQPRVDFLMDLLKEAQMAEVEKGTSLHEFLKPMLTENNSQ